MTTASRRAPSPLLVGLCAGVMLGTALAVLRVQPAARAALSRRDQRVALQQELDAAPPIIDLSTIVDEVAALRVERDALTTRNAERALRIASAAEVPGLEHRVAALAREAGLRLVAQDAAASAGPRARRLNLAGDFAGLWRFIGRLESLPHRVVLRDLQVDVRPQDAPLASAAAPVRAPLRSRPPEPPLLIQVTVIP